MQNGDRTDVRTASVSTIERSERRRDLGTPEVPRTVRNDLDQCQ